MPSLNMTDKVKNDSGVPEHLQEIYRIQTNHNGGKWSNCYGLLTKSEASVYWRGQSAFNGYQARLLCRGKEIERKGDHLSDDDSPRSQSTKNNYPSM